MDYYTALVHDDVVAILSGPHPDYTTALDGHVARLLRVDYWRPTVVMDTLRGPQTEEEWRWALMNDPLLHAAYQMGRRE